MNCKNNFAFSLMYANTLFNCFGVVEHSITLLVVDGVLFQCR